jgi:hypothetical protein
MLMSPRFHRFLIDSDGGLLDFASAGLFSSISPSSIAQSGRGQQWLSTGSTDQREGKQRQREVESSTSGGKGSRAAHKEGQREAEQAFRQRQSRGGE